jgi:hypothetical protein
MKPIQHNTSPKVTLPDNLTRLVSPGELVQWTLEAVQTLFWSNPPDGPTPVASGGFNPRVLLTVLTYSYATGVFNSAEISGQCQQEAVCRYLSMGIKYAPDCIRLFRGQNAQLLKRTLAFVIRRVYERAFLSADASTKPNAAGVWSLAIGQEDAQWRFQRALQTDRATCDFHQMPATSAKAVPWLTLSRSERQH